MELLPRRARTSQDARHFPAQILQQVRGRNMNLDLSSLRSVIAAAEHGSFRQAATALNLKQSALSRRIRHLEEQVGFPLFERSSGGVRLTPAGASMTHAARRLFDEIDHMVTASRLADCGEAGVLKAGFGTAVSTNKVRTVLAEHIKSFPGIGIQVTERSPAQLAAALGAGDIDVAIVAGQARQHSGPSMSLWSERIVAALSSRHPLSNNEVIDWNDLKDETFRRALAKARSADMNRASIGATSFAGSIVCSVSRPSASA